MKPSRSHGRLTALAMTAAAWTILALTTPASQAAMQTFITQAGAKESGGSPVNAKVTFTESGNTLTITLTNLLANPGNIAQALSGLFFTVSGGTLAGTALSSSSPVANLIQIAGNGTTSSAGTGAPGFVYTQPTSTQGLLNVLAGTGHAGPAHLIIGPAGPGGVYTSNSSIAGSVPHNPFINQTATFTITGIAANTIVTSATFSFGTSAGNNVVAPEPSTLAIAGLGALGFIGYGLRRRLKK